MIKDHDEFLQYKQGRSGDNSDAVSVKSHAESVYSTKTSKTTLKENSVMNGGEVNLLNFAIPF